MPIIWHYHSDLQIQHCSCLTDEFNLCEHCAGINPLITLHMHLLLLIPHFPTPHSSFPIPHSPLSTLPCHFITWSLIPLTSLTWSTFHLHYFHSPPPPFSPTFHLSASDSYMQTHAVQEVLVSTPWVHMSVDVSHNSLVIAVNLAISVRTLPPALVATCVYQPSALQLGSFVCRCRSLTIFCV